MSLSELNYVAFYGNFQHFFTLGKVFVMLEISLPLLIIFVSAFCVTNTNTASFGACIDFAIILQFAMLVFHFLRLLLF